MSDLISSQAAIDVIDAVFPVDPMKSEYAQGIACGAALAKTYVEQLPAAQQEPHWIPCSERLPIKAGHYLCSFEKPNRIDRIHVDLSYWTGGRWYGYVADAITAWMPLPEPYKEGQE